MATYRDAGVDLDAADRLVAGVARPVTATWHDGVVGGFGGFAAGITLPPGYTNPVLMMSTDGVGTKAAVARAAGRLDGLGWDLVAMCIDDLAAAGARPLAMTDYLAVGRLEVALAERLIGSVAAACAAAGVALLGGETAEHPGVMEAGDFDLAGTALGIVERGAEIDGSSVRPGDVLLGIDSPNVRSNGFSLVRSAVLTRVGLDDELPGTGASAAEALLAPSVLYAPVVGSLLSAVAPHGLAHITGGGLPGNVARILPESCDADLDRAAWEIPAVFAAIAEVGGIAADEMFRTFNMGIGFVAVVAPADVAAAIEAIAAHGRHASVIGTIVPGSGTVRFTGR
jgi:phosphoribosylformylglycinamidine cyclo-ligase